MQSAPKTLGLGIILCSSVLPVCIWQEYMDATVYLQDSACFTLAVP